MPAKIMYSTLVHVTFARITSPNLLFQVVGLDELF